MNSESALCKADLYHTERNWNGLKYKLKGFIKPSTKPNNELP